jgi:hypothetical protein
MINAHTILLGKPEVKIPLGRRLHRWKDNIKAKLTDIIYGDVTRYTCPRIKYSGGRY